jgi:hypothetical protein
MLSKNPTTSTSISHFTPVQMARIDPNAVWHERFGRNP